MSKIEAIAVDESLLVCHRIVCVINCSPLYPVSSRSLPDCISRDGAEFQGDLDDYASQADPNYYYDVTQLV
uniref:BTB/POZ domain-containing protein n=1 Tax=Ascaris lumbricoides TaxID=6252 RepID=A0A0M3IBL0_ASCLU